MARSPLLARCKKVLEGAGGFVVEAFIGWGDAFAEKEVSSRLVGCNELGGGTVGWRSVSDSSKVGSGRVLRKP